MAEIQLTTLGRTDLTGPGGRAILSVLSQPKRLALLVYLAVEGSGGLIRRDTVAALFWPDHDQGDARANLRKSLHFLRKSLGADAIVTRGDEELGVDASLLHCDVVQLLNGEPIPVDGSFLEGFHFSGAPVEWEDWMEEVRGRIRARMVEMDGHDVGSPDLPTPREASGAEASPSARSRVSPRRGLGIALSGAAVLLVAAMAGLLRPEMGSRGSVRYDRIVLGSGVQYPRVVHRRYALPPDGSGILFADSVNGRWDSWWKPMNQVAAVMMPELDRVVSPVFSPDGRWIAFARDGFLLKQSLDGAISLVLSDSVSGDFSPSIAWLESGRILFEDLNHDLRSVAEEGGAPELVATAAALGHPFHVSGAAKDDGAFVVGCTPTCESAIPRLSFVDFERDTVLDVRTGIWMAWAMSDRRVVMVDTLGAVSAALFDPSSGELGPATPLLKGVRVSPLPQVALGEDGSLLYIPGGVEPIVRMPMWVRRDGREEPVDPTWPPLLNIRSLSLSPDGTRLAVGMRWDTAWALGERIWIKELPRGPLSPLTVGPQDARRPAWTPDGQSLAFITQFLREDGTWASFVSALPADASTLEPVEMLKPDRQILEAVLTRDGRTAAVRTGDAAEGQGNLAFASMGEPSELVSILESSAGEYGIDLSPDDRWLAYVSEVSGRPEVYVRPFPGPGPRVQISEDGGVEPRWARSGSEIFFRSLGPAGPSPRPLFMMAARVRADSVLHVESLERLFPDPYFRGNHIRLYDIMPDDEQFILISPYNRSRERGEVVYSRGWYWTDEVQERLRR